MRKLLSLALGVVAALSSLVSVIAPSSVNAASSGFCYTFTTNLGEGRSLSQADAQALQTALTNAGVWNLGTSIITYNDAVASAVSGFQEKYAAEILAPNGLSYGTGFVGASTRAELNALYGCSTSSSGTTSSGTNFQCPSGWTCTAPSQVTTTYTCPTGWTCAPTTTSVTTNPTISADSGSATPVTPSPVNSSSGIFHIASISPLSGSAGQTVTLTGTGFSSQTQVVINNPTFTAGIGGPVAPSSVSSDGTSLTFVVPSNLASGLYVISAENVSGMNAPSSNSVDFSIGSPVNPTPSFSLAGVPSIQKSSSSQNSQGNITSTYTATFDVNVTAGYAPLTFGLANASIPAFDITPSFVAVYKNGVQDQLSNYNLTLSYSAPVSNVIMSSDGSAFFVNAGQTATIPVTYLFSVINPGANAYAVELEGVRSYSGINSSMEGSSTWRTPSV